MILFTVFWQSFGATTVECSCKKTEKTYHFYYTIKIDCRWNDKYHSKAPEAFWIWVEDPDTDIMYYHEYFLITKKQVITREPQELIITIPISEPLPPQYYVRATSER